MDHVLVVVNLAAHVLVMIPLAAHVALDWGLLREVVKRLEVLGLHLYLEGLRLHLWHRYLTPTTDVKVNQIVTIVRSLDIWIAELRH